MRQTTFVLIIAFLLFGTSFVGAQIYRKVMGPTTFVGTVTSTQQFLAAAGTSSAPAYAFSGDPNTGINNVANSQLLFVVDALNYLAVNDAVSPTSVIVRTDAAIAWASSGISVPDVFLVRDRAGVMEIRDVAQLNCRSAPPSSPAAGDLYCDSTANELCFYDGSAWQGISTGTDANCS